jgi:cytochrome b561
MKFFNNEIKYGIISILFHWITFLILIFQIPMGFYLADLEFSDFKLSIENYHSIFGIIIFYITLLRIIWKFINVSPLVANQMESWQSIVSKINHWLLYLSLLAITSSGVIKKLLSGEDVNFLFTSLSLEYFNFEIVEIAEKIHVSATILLIMLLILHILAVLYHHIFLKDPILKKIS